MQLETLAHGYGLIEGPRVDEQNRLYFSDVPNGGVYRRSPDGAIETLIPRRRGVGGIALNAAGGIVCSGRSLIRWDEATRQSRDLFTAWEGRPLRGLARGGATRPARSRALPRSLVRSRFAGFA